jgi:hypothetical protein
LVYVQVQNPADYDSQIPTATAEAVFQTPDMFLGYINQFCDTKTAETFSFSIGSQSFSEVPEIPGLWMLKICHIFLLSWVFIERRILQRAGIL